MKNKLLAGAAGLLIAGYAAMGAYAVMSQDIEELLLCADSGGVKVPFSKALCRQYLFTFRGSRQDIDALHQGIGAWLVVQGESTSSEREQVLRYLIGKGLDVNRIDRHLLTPLHGAVLVNSKIEAEMLLRNGAQANVKDKKFGLTPLELALKLQREGKAQADRQEVIALLQTVQSAP